MFPDEDAAHGTHFRSAFSGIDLLILIGIVVGPVFLVMNGIRTAWWSSLILLVLPFLTKPIAFWIEDWVGGTAISLLGKSRETQLAAPTWSVMTFSPALGLMFQNAWASSRVTRLR